MGNNCNTTCEKGKYSMDNWTNCRNCPKGTYNDLNGGDSIDSCKECQSGTYNDLSG